MKILDVPQTGKLGLTVTFPSRNGLIRRSLVTPANPNTYRQLKVRSYFTASAHAYDALTTAQQNAWITAAGQYQSRATLGQSGPLTGLQLFVKQNAILRQFGQDPVEAPLPVPTFGELAPQNVVITNALGVVAIKLTCPTSPGEGTVIRGCAPQRSGVRRLPNTRILGTCPAAVQGSADITALYTAVFGVPVEGQRLFIEAQLMENGWYGPKSVFSALVPASA
jgi:hypothetical protein